MGVKNENRKKRKKRTKYKGGVRLPRRETELIQVAVSFIILVAALLGRSLAPDKIEDWKEFVFKDTDFSTSIAKLGERAMVEGELLDAFSELCIDVFGGE